VDVVVNDLKRNEITLVSIINLFPLRYLRPVEMLRDRYEKRLESGGARARLEVHLDGAGADLPKLFIPSAQALRAEGLSYLILAKCLGIVEQTRDSSGNCRLRLLTKDTDGFENPPVLLGGTLLEAAERIDETNFDLIKTSTLDRVNRAVQQEESRAALRKAVLAEVEAFKTSQCDGDIADPRYETILSAGKAAMKLAASLA
jgi:hypothetical protein